VGGLSVWLSGVLFFVCGGAVVCGGVLCEFIVVVWLLWSGSFFVF
jgi:hypothetical protein